MTIHFHTKHFQETNLPLLDYMILLFLEQKEGIHVTRKDIMNEFKIAVRTAERIIANFVKSGVIKRVKLGHYTLTDKYYEKVEQKAS